LRSVCLGPHLERLPDDLKEPYLERVVERLGEDSSWSTSRLTVEARRPIRLDYVRLNIDARSGP
jgi:hypothetical protein